MIDSDFSESLLRKIVTLNDVVWEKKLERPFINDWLDNFDGSKTGNSPEQDRLHALFLLSHFMYFHGRHIRELLKSLFRDFFQYPLVEAYRRSNSDVTDHAAIQAAFEDQLNHTRFLGVGNPSESGSHLLYIYRQENALPKSLFITPYEIFGRTTLTTPQTLASPEIRRYVFVDDLCGSGDQARGYCQDIISDIKSIDSNIEIIYLCLFATSKGLEETSKLFDTVRCVYELDESFKTFSANSRYFPASDTSIDKDLCENICKKYGENLFSPSLGHGDSQLLIGFSYNTPDNTLPIFWCDNPNPPRWNPVFRRYPKLY